MIRTVLFFLCIAATSTLISVDGIAGSEISPNPEQWITFDLTPCNQLRFMVTVAGHPAMAILDTGVSHTVLSRRFAATNAIASSMRTNATAIGGNVAIGWTAPVAVRLGADHARTTRMSVADLPATATGSATPVDVLVGRDLTAAYALEIDYAARRFRLLPSGRMPFPGQTASLAILPKLQIYVTTLSLGARRFAPMVVDTGDGAALTLTAAGWAAAGMDAIPTTTSISFGLVGSVVSKVAIVPELRLGDVTARNVETRIEPNGGFSDTIGAAGRIGSGLLQNYRVLLDPAAGRMVLAPGPGADRPPVRSTSGLLFGLARDRLRVLHVMAGGPAAATGWKGGEEICAIDGVAVTRDYANSPLSRWSADTPGRNVGLTLCNGTQRRLTLRNFY